MIANVRRDTFAAAVRQFGDDRVAELAGVQPGEVKLMRTCGGVVPYAWAKRVALALGVPFELVFEWCES